MFYSEQCQNKDKIWRNGQQQEKLHAHTPFISQLLLIYFLQPAKQCKQAGEVGRILFQDGLVPLTPLGATYSRRMNIHQDFAGWHTVLIREAEPSGFAWQSIGLQ